MKGHIHTDALTILTAALATALVFHVGRGAGAWLAGKGMSGLGTAVGGFFTFNGG